MGPAYKNVSSIGHDLRSETPLKVYTRTLPLIPSLPPFIHLFTPAAA